MITLLYNITELVYVLVVVVVKCFGAYAWLHWELSGEEDYTIENK